MAAVPATVPRFARANSVGPLQGESYMKHLLLAAIAAVLIGSGFADAAPRGGLFQGRPGLFQRIMEFERNKNAALRSMFR